MSDKIYIGQQSATFEGGDQLLPFSKVVIWYDDENAFQAGDDTGRTLELDNPWATQAMADKVLAQIKGYVYRPYQAEDALLDPAAELGDGVTLGGIYSVLGSINAKFDQQMAADIGAPTDEEINHEYPYLSPQNRALKRKVTLGANYYGTRITRRNGLEIVKTDGETEKSRVILNSDTLAFYNDNGSEALYFDPATGKYKFVGDVEINEGSININNNFVVDAQGNVTLSGNVNMSGGNINWGGAFPYKSQFAVSENGPWHNNQQPNDKWRRDSYDAGKTWGVPYQFTAEDGITAAEVRTIITDQLVASPNIAGGKFWDIRQTAWISMGSEAITNGSIGYLDLFVEDYSDNEPMFRVWCREELSGRTRAIALHSMGYDFLVVDGNYDIVSPMGSWDFSNADISGLTANGLDGSTVYIDSSRNTHISTGGDMVFSVDGDVRVSVPDGVFRVWVGGVTWELSATGWEKV